MRAPKGGAVDKLLPCRKAVEGSALDYLKRLEFAGKAPEIADVAATLRDLGQRRQIKRRQLGRQTILAV